MPGIKLNGIKEWLWRMGWIDLTSGAPYQRLMDATERTSDEIGQVLNGVRHNAAVQDAIASAVGMNVLELFGELAWPRQASRAMQLRLEQLDEAEQAALRAMLAPGGAVAQAREAREAREADDWDEEHTRQKEKTRKKLERAYGAKEAD